MSRPEYSVPSSSNRRQHVCRWCIWSVLSLALQSCAFANDRIAFVAAFERFGRHGDISVESSGTLLVSELSCTSCHQSSGTQFAPKKGPNLDAIGSRVRADWVRRFLESPSRVKPGTTMPDVMSDLPDEEKAATIDAISAYLSTLRQPHVEIKASGANPVPAEFWNKGDSERGRKLYHQIGCVACHAAEEDFDVAGFKPSPYDEMLDQLEPEELKELGLSSAARRFESVPMPVLAEKYSAESLTFFLLNPEHSRPSGRMPNFQLQAIDAADISSWLLKKVESHQSASNSPNDSTQPLDASTQMELVQRGRKLFVELHCINCHDVNGLDRQAVESPFEQLELDSGKSCVHLHGSGAETSTDHHRKRGQPVFELDQKQIDAIRSAQKLEESPEALEQSLLRHNCYACHERDSLGGVGRDRKPYFETVGGVDIGDEGRLPPVLTGVGRRLNSSWLSNVMNGKGPIRPHMTIRMPLFPKEVTTSIPEMIAATDGVDSPAPAEQVFVKADRDVLLKAGRQLMDTGCVQCHSFKGHALPGVVGVDLEGVTQRLRAEWMHDFLKDPSALKPRTRMPTFFPNGRSQNASVLDGDTERQLAAMYAYLDDLANQPLPEKIEEARSRNYELTPTDRPILLRTFMPNAGTHTIAVGSPHKIHFAFDAEQVRLAELWKGRFLDAEGTWFVRSAPPANPLGEAQMSLPAGPDIAVLESEDSPWPTNAEAAGVKFRGYRIDKQGTPTFLYEVGSLQVSDQIVAADHHTLRRTISTSPLAPSPKQANQVWMRVLSDLPAPAAIEVSVPPTNASGRSTTTSPRGLSVSVVLPDKTMPKQRSRIQPRGATADWLHPLTQDQGETLVIEYHW